MTNLVRQCQKFERKLYHGTLSSYEYDRFKSQFKVTLLALDPEELKTLDRGDREVILRNLDESPELMPYRQALVFS